MWPRRGISRDIFDKQYRAAPIRLDMGPIDPGIGQRRRLDVQYRIHSRTLEIP
jgi:hypothetical protein